MSYMIKHSINAKPFKMATAFNSANYTITAGTPRSLTLSLDTLVQTSGMGLSLATNQITLVDGKTYLIYFKAGLQNSTEGRGAEINIQKNGVSISAQPVIPAVTTATIIGSTAWLSPMNVAMAIVTATTGDTISFFYNRSAGASYTDTVDSDSCKAFILEIS